MVDSNPMNKNRKSKGGGASSGGNNEVSENPNTVSKKLSQDNKTKREQESSNKPSETEIKLKQRGQEIKLKQKAERRKKVALKLKQDQEKRRVENQKKASRRLGIEKQEKIVSQRKSATANIAGKKGSLEKIGPKDQSVTATGKAAVNLAKNVTDVARKTAALPSRIATARAKAKLGRMQMSDGKDKKPDYKKAAEKGRSPEGGTAIQKARYGGARLKRGIATSTQGPRKAIAGGIRGIAKKIRSESFIHEAENGNKEVKKEKIDVMKGTNKIEVNPKSLPEAKKMTKKQIEKRDEIADAISTREMNKRYGDKNVKYAIATKLAMKKKKKIDEAKIDQTMTPAEKRSARNERQMKKDAPFRSLSKNYVSKLNQKYRREFIHEPKRGVKKVKGNMTLKDRVGEMRGMSRPNRLARIAQHAKKIDVTDVKKYKDGSYGGTTEYSHYEPKGPVVMESGLEVQNVSDGIKFREYEFIDVVKPEPMKSPKNNITWTEAKVPEGLMKLAATVAANNKKRKNALQIQKYIGEDKKMGRQSDEDLSAARDKFSKMDQSMPSNQFMLKRINKEINRRKKANPKPDVTTEGKGSNPNKRYIGDPIVTSKKSFTKTGKIGIDYYTDDEKKKSEKEKIKDAKDPKKNASRERATQNMQMLKRMTPEQKYARKMRIKQQQKDKK